jgi:hypothetical protein
MDLFRLLRKGRVLVSSCQHRVSSNIFNTALSPSSRPSYGILRGAPRVRGHRASLVSIIFSLVLPCFSAGSISLSCFAPAPFLCPLALFFSLTLHVYHPSNKGKYGLVDLAPSPALSLPAFSRCHLHDGQIHLWCTALLIRELQITACTAENNICSTC